MAVTPRVQAGDIDGVPVLRFVDRLLFDERTVREAGEQLAASVPNDGQPIRLILDFTGVEMISSSLLGKLILAQRRVDASGGTLVLCEMGESVRGVFRTANLDRLFKIARDRAEARAAF